MSFREHYCRREIQVNVKGLPEWSFQLRVLVTDAELDLTDADELKIKSPIINRILEIEDRWAKTDLKNLPKDLDEMEALAERIDADLSEYEWIEEIFESEAILAPETGKWVASFPRYGLTPEMIYDRFLPDRLLATSEPEGFSDG
jgi:hypothetical protein